MRQIGMAKRDCHFYIETTGGGTCDRKLMALTVCRGDGPGILRRTCFDVDELLEFSGNLLPQVLSRLNFVITSRAFFLENKTGQTNYGASADLTA